MMTSNQIRVLLISMMFLAGCGFSHELDEPNVSATSPTPQSRAISSRTSGTTKTFENADGWPLPELAWESNSTSFMAKGRVAIKVEKLNSNIELTSDQPFATINYPFHAIRIIGAKRYSVGGRIFCYKFQFVPLLKDGQSGGSASYFAYYDEDGDGEFESLVLDEIGAAGVSAFANLPHVPEWVLRLGRPQKIGVKPAFRRFSMRIPLKKAEGQACDIAILNTSRRGAAFLWCEGVRIYSTTNEVTGWTSQAVARQLEGLCLRL